MRGFHWRDLPMPDGEAAERKFESFCDEATRWKGPPPRLERSRGRRLAAWPDIEIRQAGRGVMILVRAPSFPWWHERATWEGEPMQALHEWLGEDVP